LDCAAELPALRADRRQIFNALYNLANNAIPETPRGGSITVKIFAVAPESSTRSGELVVEVRDTGRGIPEHIRARLFTDDAVSTKQAEPVWARASWAISCADITAQSRCKAQPRSAPRLPSACRFAPLTTNQILNNFMKLSTRTTRISNATADADRV
jgi:hypothetical protein